MKDYQQVVLGLMWSKPYGIRCWSEPKKSGKSHITECVIIAEYMLRAGTKVGIFANDSEQAESIIFKGATEVIKHNQALRESAKLLAKVIRFSNDSEIEWFAHDYEGGAGHRRRINVIDEPCFFEGERARRLYEELLPIPTIKDSYLWLSTTKGFSGESTFLEELYRRGIGGKRLSRKYELYEDKKYVMFWSHTPRQPWQTRPFYDEQRRLLRPATYLRQHENRWVSSESAFITREQWQACIDPSHRIALNRWVETYWGLDLGIKSDAAAIVGVCYDGGRIAIVDHRLWRPTKDEPVIISDVEEACSACVRGFG